MQVDSKKTESAVPRWGQMKTGESQGRHCHGDVKWARLWHTPRSLPRGSLREFPSLDRPVFRCMLARTRDSQETCLSFTLMR